jgi:hypothetical protein
METQMSVTSTEVKFTNIDDVANFSGDFTGDQLKDQLAELYPFLENCSYTEEVNDDVRTIIFTEKMGTKGLL